MRGATSLYVGGDYLAAAGEIPRISKAKGTVMIESRDPSRIRQLALVSVAALVFSIVGTLSASTSEAAQICPQPNPEGCMVRCLAHKRRCFDACRVRKKQCVHKVRVEAKSCVLNCRAEVRDQDPGTCKRECIALAKEQAHNECLADRPVCLKQCNPQGCRRRCGHFEAPVDAPVTEAPLAPAAMAAAHPGMLCEPPVDNECLDGCARELRSCSQIVIEDVRLCVSSCSEFGGEERRLCMADCATAAREAGRLCVEGFRQCAAGCRDTVAVTDPPVAP